MLLIILVELFCVKCFVFDSAQNPFTFIMLCNGYQKIAYETFASNIAIRTFESKSVHHAKAGHVFSRSYEKPSAQLLAFLLY